MISANKRDPKESNEGLLRRFNRKVQQSGILSSAKANQYRSKPVTRRERRLQALARREIKNQRNKSTRFS